MIRGGLRKSKIKEYGWGYLFILPWVLGFLIFTLYPTVMSLYMSFFKWDLFGDKAFIKIVNYKELFGNDVFKLALTNTLIYAAFSTVISVVFGILVAFALLSARKSNLVLRTIIYLPCLVIGLAFAMMMQPLFDPNTGLINRLITAFGGKGQMWLSTRGQAVWVLVLMSFWGLGGPMLIFMAAFKNVDKQIIEAAEIDGASRVRVLLQINIPIIMPVIVYQLIVGIIYGLQVFDGAIGLATASGTAQFGMGNNNALATLAYLLYRTGFSGANGEMGRGAAVGWLIFAVTAVFSVIILAFIKKTRYYTAE